MRNITKIFAVIAASLILLMLAAPAGAKEYSAEIDLKAVGPNLKLSLSPEPKPGNGYELFDLKNMNPGDCRLAKVTFTNNYSRALDLHMAAYEPWWDPVGGTGSGLLDMLDITISRGSTVLYKGKVAGMPLYGNSSKEPIKLGRYSPGPAPVVITIQVCLPGPETGNKFQGMGAGVKFIFGIDPVNRNYPPPGDDDDWHYYRPEPPNIYPEEELVIRPEPPAIMPKTGQGVPYVYYLLGALVLFGGIQLARKPKRR